MRREVGHSNNRKMILSLLRATRVRQGATWPKDSSMVSRSRRKIRGGANRLGLQLVAQVCTNTLRIMKRRRCLDRLCRRSPPSKSRKK